MALTVVLGSSNTFDSIATYLTDIDQANWAGVDRNSRNKIGAIRTKIIRDVMGTRTKEPIYDLSQPLAKQYGIRWVNLSADFIYSSLQDKLPPNSPFFPTSVAERIGEYADRYQDQFEQACVANDKSQLDRFRPAYLMGAHVRFRFNEALQKGHLETVEWILRHASDKLTWMTQSFTTACEANQLSSVRLLLESKKVNPKSMKIGFCEALRTGAHDVVQWMLQREEQTPGLFDQDHDLRLCLASALHNQGSLALLLETPFARLHWSAVKKTIQEELKSGAFVDDPDTLRFLYTRYRDFFDLPLEQGHVPLDCLADLLRSNSLSPADALAFLRRSCFSGPSRSVEHLLQQISYNPNDLAALRQELLKRYIAKKSSIPGAEKLEFVRKLESLDRALGLHHLFPEALLLTEEPEAPAVEERALSQGPKTLAVEERVLSEEPKTPALEERVLSEEPEPLAIEEEEPAVAPSRSVCPSVTQVVCAGVVALSVLLQSQNT